MAAMIHRSRNHLLLAEAQQQKLWVQTRLLPGTLLVDLTVAIAVLHNPEAFRPSLL
jgi:hypothetical protein